eukprot:9009545-Heterocapsa_arctica.AAC.2
MSVHQSGAIKLRHNRVVSIYPIAARHSPPRLAPAELPGGGSVMGLASGSKAGKAKCSWHHTPLN